MVLAIEDVLELNDFIPDLEAMAQRARLFFRQVRTMMKQFFEYKKFKKSEKFIKNAYHKRFLKSSSFHFLKIIKFIFSRPCFFRFAT